MKRTGAFTLGFLVRRRHLRLIFVAILLIALFLFYGLSTKLLGIYSARAAAISKIINFQGKITAVSNGTNVADGQYAMQFKLYDALTSGTLLWTETYDQGSGACTKPQLTSGVFGVKLGSCNALTGIDFTTGSLYLTVNFAPTGTAYDGEMSPRKQLNAAPFAFSANGVGGDGRIDIAYAPSTTTSPAANITYNPSGASSNNGLSVTTNSNVTGAAALITQAGSGVGLQLAGAGAAARTIKSDNSALILQTTTGGNITLDPQTGIVAGTGALTIRSGGATALTVDAGGAAALNLGTANATSVVIGRSGQSVQLKGFSSIVANGVFYSSDTSGTVAETAASTAAQCLVSASAGAAPTWGSCGAGGSTRWDQILAPSGAGLTLSMGNNLTAFTWGTATTASDMFALQDTTGNTGTGYVLSASTIGTSTAKPFKAAAQGTTIIDTTSAGAVTIGATATQTGAVTVQSINTTTGINLNANSVTSNTSGAVIISTTGVTTGLGLLVTDSSTNLQSGGILAKYNATGNTAGTVLNITGGTAQTTGSGLDVSGVTYVHGASETGSLAKLTFSDTSSAVFTTTTNGLLITPTVNTTGGATRIINAANINPTLTACAGTCTYNGLLINASGTGFTQNGINIGNIASPGAGIETALNIGTGWDAGLNILSGGNLFKANSVNLFQLQNSAGLSIDNINTSAGAGFANLIYNPSFEQNIHNWVTKGVPSTPPVWDNTASNAKFGNGTLKFVGTAAGDGAQYNFPFAASTAYSASFWAKTASGTATLRLDRQDNGSDVGGCTDSAVTTTWTQFTCTFTTGATINTSTSNIFIKQNAVGTPTVFIDGITLTLGSTPLSYSMPGNNIQVDADYSNITLNAGQKPDIQPWQLNSNALPSGRRGATSVTANGFAYFIGGTTANGTAGAPVTIVNYAQMKADGSVGAGAWSTTTVLPVALYGHSSVVINGYLYVIGGCSDSSATAACTTPVATVYYSKLNSDGTVGTWQTAATSLSAARGFGAAVVSNGFIYYLGGYNASAQTAVYSGRASADGNVSGWTTTGVTALGTGRYGLTALNANGKIYSIGGCSDAGATCGTAIATVEFATPANDGTLGAWSAATSLPTATGFHSTTILNGHIFNVGGRQAGAPIASVIYSKINSVGPLGVWTTSAYILPAVRQQSTSLFVNSYIYNMGGFDGTTTLPTSIHFASGPRVSIFGGLDLVTLNAQTLTDYAGGGTLTAGNTRVVGDLRVDGFADLNNGLSVDSAINLNAVSAVSGQNIFNINNLNSNSIFSVRHMSTNFGSLVTAGAFMQKNSYWGEEFNNGKLTACGPLTGAAPGASINAWARGDGGGQGVAAACSGTANATVNGGELNASTATNGTTTFGSCTFASPGVTTVNGVERITATSVATTGATANCVENLGGTTTTSNKIYLATNLPIVAMKVKPSTLPAATAGSRVQIGLFPGDSASGTGVNSPANAIYFTNCSTWNNAAVPTGCSNTNWYGVTSGATTATVVTCSVGAATLTTNFSYLRIEVRSTTDVHFFADYNTTDGINESECGTGSATNITASALTPWMQAMFNAATASSTALDIDYFRGWQDDTNTASVPDQVAPLTLDPTPTLNPFDATVTLAKFMSMTDADVAVAKMQQVDTGRIIASLEIVTPKVTTNGLTVDSLTSLKDAITFQNDIVLIGRPYFNSDTAGFALIKQGAKRVDITFDKDYLDPPVVSAGIAIADDPSLKGETDQAKIDAARAAQDQLVQQLFDSGVQYIVEHTNEHGFTIMLNKPAPQNISFSWTALAVKGAKLFSSKNPAATQAIAPTSSPQTNPISGTIAGDSTGTPSGSATLPATDTNTYPPTNASSPPPPDTTSSAPVDNTPSAPAVNSDPQSAPSPDVIVSEPSATP